MLSCESSVGKLRRVIVLMILLMAGHVQAQSGPDRQVSVSNVQPAVLASGDSVNVSTQVSNIGNQASAASSLGLYLSLDSAISTSDTELNSFPIPSLGPGSGLNSEDVVIINQAPGAYWVGACVAADGADVNPANDCSAGIQITLPDVDLVMLPVTPSLTRFPSGHTVSFNTAVDNRGNAASAASTLRFKRSTNSSITTSDADFLTAAVPVLEGGERWITDRSGPVTADPGIYWLGACVDVQAGELSKSNNCSAGVQVEVLNSNLPDLVVSQVSANPSSWAVGAFTDLFARVRNQGSAASNATTVQFFLSSDANITSADNLLGQTNIAGLAASATVETGIFVDPQPSPGNYWVGACVVTDGLEFATGNNCSAAFAVTISNNNNACTSQPLSCGSMVSGSLSSSDCDDGPRGAGYYARNHTFAGSEGDQVSINANWNGDGYLYLANPSGAVVAQNDDGSGALNSSIGHTLGSTGTWTVWTTSALPSVNLTFDLSLACTQQTAPDLVVENPALDPAQAQPADNLTFSFTTRNQGDASAVASTARILLSVDAVISIADTELVTTAVAALDAAASSEHQVGITAPAMAGNYWVGACVDAVAGEAESANNCSAAVALNVVDPASDLTVDTPVASAQTIEFGAVVNLSTMVRNAGPDSSAPTTVRYVRSVDASITADDPLIKTSAVAAIAANGAQSDSIQFIALVEPGPYWLGVCVDTVSGETDTSNNCSAGLAVTVMAGAGIPINAGLNDAWFNAATNGQGFFINVFPLIGKVFLAWFTYELERPDGSILANLGDPGHRWITAFGDYVDGVAVLDVEITSGGVFNVTEPKPTQQLDGTITLQFASCAEGSLDFDIPSIDMAGFVPFTRLANDNVGWCQDLVAALTEARLHSRPVTGPAAKSSHAVDGQKAGAVIEVDESFRINEGLNDAWFNPATDGQGFFINVFPDLGKMFLAWFTYDTERPDASVTAQLGEPGHRWLTAFGDYSGGRADLEIEMTTGGVFNAGEPAPVQDVDGIITVEFADCEVGTVTFDIDSVDLQGVVPIQRLALDNVAACEALNAAGGGAQ